jgi:hypothetical protein
VSAKQCARRTSAKQIRAGALPCAFFLSGELPLRRAQFVLVVVRSELELPLTSFYGSLCDLRHDAEMQLNISGSNYVVYVFALDDELRPRELKRISYPAND